MSDMEPAPTTSTSGVNVTTFCPRCGLPGWASCTADDCYHPAPNGRYAQESYDD